MSAGSVAVIDASIVYGAIRSLRYGDSRADTSRLSGAQQLDDKALFFEFLHDLLLYDRILLDSSSIVRIGADLKLLIARVNKRAEEVLFSTRTLATTTAMPAVVSAVCRQLRDCAHYHGDLTRIPIPWAYRDSSHHDFDVISKAAMHVGLDVTLVPLAVFAYRGLCYAGYSHNMVKRLGVASTYVAAPGRIQAMRPILDSTEIRRVEYPKRGYHDLIDMLKLPATGYDFSFVGSLPSHEMSSLTQAFYDSPAEEVFEEVLSMRRSERGRGIRNSWRERIWVRSKSLAAGASYTQNISNSEIGGDVYQVIIGEGAIT
jgi:hypothetical protein